MKPIPTNQNITTNVIEITSDSGHDIKFQEGTISTKLKTGTTTVGCIIKDGVIFATDNRATMGSYVASKDARKLHQIQPHIYMTIAGGVADAIYLIDLLKAETEIYRLRNSKQIAVSAAAKLLQNILYNKKGFYQVGHILGGYTEAEGSKLYNIEGYGSILSEQYTSIGSGSPFALGVLETEWKENLSAEDGIHIAVKAVRSAIIRDIASGNGIDVVVLQKGKAPLEKRYEVDDESLIDGTFKS
ncbi:MAG: proteasome subunit beta [Promethearchaeota archaeon]|nr:MAG: proteasome subunit beta [Candidatus Lokiarchaeota archaeon]